ncbi:hypothetical protein NDU88_000553 [Pleurodeles waltl]|uniref:Uncharacterized protein n=1 Tax=Pleurodeles waltl TaxID=8319 RepID=A0AAV7S5L2_PLEWA|nr:hypothetical protein NDU88_000553 [Pleurodeles waltl]
MNYDEPSTSQSAGGLNWDRGFEETLDFDEENEMAMVGANFEDIGGQGNNQSLSFDALQGQKRAAVGAIVELVKGLYPVQLGTLLETPPLITGEDRTIKRLPPPALRSRPDPHQWGRGLSLRGSSKSRRGGRTHCRTVPCRPGRPANTRSGLRRGAQECDRAARGVPGETRSTEPPSITSQNLAGEVEAVGRRVRVVTAWQLGDQKAAHQVSAAIPRGAGGSDRHGEGSGLHGATWITLPGRPRRLMPLAALHATIAAPQHSVQCPKQ